MTEETKPTTPVVEEQKTEEKPTMTLEQALALIEKQANDIAKANREAAKYHVDKNEARIIAEKKAEETVTERLSALESQLKEERRRNLITSVAHKHNLPDALAERLRGETVEELEADAASLVAFVKPTELQKPPPLSPTAPTGAPTITLDAIKKMTPEQINKNWDAVSAVMAQKG